MYVLSVVFVNIFFQNLKSIVLNLLGVSPVCKVLKLAALYFMLLYHVIINIGVSCEKKKLQRK